MQNSVQSVQGKLEGFTEKKNVMIFTITTQDGDTYDVDFPFHILEEPVEENTLRTLGEDLKIELNNGVATSVEVL